MPKKKARSTRKTWTVADVKALKASAGKQPARKIAKSLRRTVASIRQKALSLRMKLRVR